MKSEWRVTCNVINGERSYAVYRLRDVKAVDHSGNREYLIGGIFGSTYRTTDESSAEALANILNKEERNGK